MSQINMSGEEGAGWRSTSTWPVRVGEGGGG